MSYKETFNLDYGMNKWEAGFEPIKPDNSKVTPFIDIAVELIHLACEFGAVKKIEVRKTVRTGVKYPLPTCVWREIGEHRQEFKKSELFKVLADKLREDDVFMKEISFTDVQQAYATRTKLPETYWRTLNNSESQS